jgi:hypothetical protein
VKEHRSLDEVFGLADVAHSEKVGVADEEEEVTCGDGVFGLVAGVDFVAEATGHGRVKYFHVQGRAPRSPS